LHRGEGELPFVEFEPACEMQVLQVDIPTGLWVVRMRMQPGATLPTHRHGGEVFAFTLQGAWKYLEYPRVNTAGSYLYEPAARSTRCTCRDQHRNHRRSGSRSAGRT
jgi:quercetin dioxygenase-like cupin family protein